MSFEGKVVLVTGGSRGIGFATASAFAIEGASVVIAGRDHEQGNNAVMNILDKGGSAKYVPCDITNASDVERMVADVVATFGRLDCAVNNAGIGGDGPSLADYPEDLWNRVLTVNLTGTWLCMKSEIAYMIRQERGVIVNVASILGLVAKNGASCSYTAAKHGVIGLTKAAALEYALNGIRVNSVCPSFTETEMVTTYAPLGSAEYQDLASQHPMGRLAQPADIAATIVWLCSDAASFITGQAIPVDGGYTAQ